MKTLKRFTVALPGILSIGAAIAVITWSSFADVPQPIIKITALGSNQFSVAITNGVTNGIYELQWRETLSDTNYLWKFLDSGTMGQTNFTFSGGQLPVYFFRASVGNDVDADGVVSWIDANDGNASIRALTITIDNPVNGSNIQ
jgi:hypothetical protein